MRYTFGTNESAAGRLAVIARVFNPSSTAFVRAYARRWVPSVLDLGCGPGFSTRMLVNALDAGTVYGLDAAEEFLVRAMDLTGECVFLRHDLTKTPFPVQAKVMYSRFLLSHLPQPVKLVNRWVKELEPEGLLMLEEVEAVESDIPVFNRYLAVNSALIASQGARLFVGGALGRGRYEAGILYNRCVAIPVRNRDAAAMFYPNAAWLWEEEPYVKTMLSDGDRKAIAEDLRFIMEGGDGRCGITWQLRRMVLKNTVRDPYLEMFI